VRAESESITPAAIFGEAAARQKDAAPCRLGVRSRINDIVMFLVITHIGKVGSNMALETAAAILTRLAFEQNNAFKSKLNNAPGDEDAVVGIMMPLFRKILSNLREAERAQERFPSSIASTPSNPDR